jgi:hypothetical protein
LFAEPDQQYGGGADQHADHRQRPDGFAEEQEGEDHCGRRDQVEQ